MYWNVHPACFWQQRRVPWREHTGINVVLVYEDLIMHRPNARSNASGSYREERASDLWSEDWGFEIVFQLQTFLWYSWLVVLSIYVAFGSISAISRLRSRRWKISEIIAARPRIKPGPLTLHWYHTVSKIKSFDFVSVCRKYGQLCGCNYSNWPS